MHSAFACPVGYQVKTVESLKMPLEELLNSSNVESRVMQCSNGSVNDSAGNQSSCEETTASSVPWTYAPVFTIIVFTLVVISNSWVIVLLSRKFTYSTRPFTLYQVNLMCANLVFVIVQNPLDIYNNLHSTWEIGEVACNLYLYANYPLAAAVVQSHLLITTNRLWAMTFPHHYRTRHSLKVAACLCGGMWMYVHVCLGSGWILDAAYYRLPVLTSGCNLNTTPPGQRIWGITTQFLNFNIPILVMAVAYLRIYIDWRKRQAKVAGERTLYMATIHRHSISGSEAGKPTRNGPTTNGMHSDEKAKKNVHGFVVLSLVTGTVMVNWIPSQGYYTAVLFTDADLSTLFKVSWILWSLQAALDPFFMALMLDDVRGFFVKRFAVFKNLQRRIRPDSKIKPAFS